MKDSIQKIPIPLCGVMLGTAALGNLLQSYSENLRYICGVAAGLLLIMILLKLILFFDAVKKDMSNPIMASVSATFTMGIMILSTYVKPFIGQGALYIWIISVSLHVLLMIYFTAKFVIKFDIKKVFASYFIVYAGIAVASITAPAYNMQNFGTLGFWVGFVTVLIMLVVVSYRYIVYKEIPEPAQSLMCIYAAPISVCVVGYIQSVEPKSYSLLIFMYTLTSILYLIGFIQLIKCIKLPFYPSMAAFTFPFVISAIASKQTMAYLINIDSPLPILKYVVLFQTIVATVSIIYVYTRFMVAIFGKQK